MIESDYVYNETEGNVSIRVHVVNETWNNTIWDIEVYFWTGDMTVEVYQEDFSVPLEYCQDYYFNLTYAVEPEIVVLHFSNETGENIGFAFSTPPAALNATLIGHMSFQGRPASSPRNVEWLVVRFFNAPGNETAWSPRNALTDNNGTFTVDNVTPGTYDIAVKNFTCLSEMNLSRTFTAGNPTDVYFNTSREGDCANGDDRITILDASRLAGKYGLGKDDPGWDANCDLNRDGSVTILDASALAGNYGKQGALKSY